MKLYTCESGVWLNENGSRFEVWNEEEQQANPRNDTYIFEVDDELVEKLNSGGYKIESDNNFKFLKVF